ncbi:MAG: ATP phosphoribosyltransferase [Hydrogenibacillus schlegelii]|nr:ATP phosphoribosyltransferase [Hydrogenibacillus schlegelii]
MGASGRGDGLRIVLPKGRVLGEALQLLRAAKIGVPPEGEDSRRLIIDVGREASGAVGAPLQFILAKPVDVPIYVEDGAADLGIVGKDVLLELERDVYELLDLGIGACRLSVAGLGAPLPPTRSMPRVATKYPRTARRFFAARGEQVEIIALSGSIELAPLLGLAERIVDIVSTGRTLRENGLQEFEVIAPITSRLIANRASLRLKADAVGRFQAALAAVVSSAGGTAGGGAPAASPADERGGPAVRPDFAGDGARRGDADGAGVRPESAGDGAVLGRPFGR